MLPALILPLIAAGVCLALNRTVASRWLGFAAAGSLAVAGAALLAARVSSGLPIVLIERDWLVIGEQTVRLRLRLDGLSWIPALIALHGGALALAALALAFPRDLRGFGGLLAALLLAPVATATGVANTDPLLLPFPWTVAALSSFVALRASGALSGSASPLVVLAAGAGGALVALAAAILPLVAAPGVISAGALAGAVALALLALGAPPLHAPLAAAAEAPAALAAVVVALGAPLLGGYTLIRYAAALGPLAPAGWGAALVAAGALVLVISAAGAAGTPHMRSIAGWQLSAQGGVLLMAASAGRTALLAAAPALLANAVLTALAAFLAIAALERRTGGDDLTALGARGPLPAPGLAMLVAAASAAGVPGTLGFWGRLWLADELQHGAPWALALLLSGSALLALTYAAPVAAFWRRDPAAEAQPARTLDIPAAIAALPLLVAGAAPEVLWRWWLIDAGRALAPDALAVPALPGALGVTASAVAAAALVAVPLLARRGPQRRASDDPETRAAGVIPPAVLGKSLFGLAWIGQPTAIGQLWEILVGVGDGINSLLALLRRYYLAVFLIAMIVVLLVFI